jgi:amino acid transporter
MTMEVVEEGGRAEQARTPLAGNMGAGRLLFVVLAFSAPMAVVSTFLPFMLIFGGDGATLAFVVSAVLLLLFAVGYVAMARHVPKPGAFYVFISSGLGKVAGMAGAFLAITSYLLMLVGSFVATGLAAVDFSASVNGPGVPWWAWALCAWFLVSIVGYFNIEVSGRILAFAMVLEIALVLAFNVAVVVRGGPDGYSSAPFSPTSLGHGDLGITLLFGVMLFLGFEGAAMFRDEVRDPNKTIPRATYGAVVFMGVLYAVSCYMLTTAYGDGASDAALASPKGMFPDAIGHYVAPAFTQLTFIMAITSAVAAQISIHNVLSRYVFNLARDNALPVYLSRVHPRHGSPHRASVTVAAAGALIGVPLSLGTPAGTGLDARLFGVSAVGVMALMIFVSLAVVAWFKRKGVPAGTSPFACFVAPVLSAVALTYIVATAVRHFDLVAGGLPGQNVGLLLVLVAVTAAGAGLAVYFRSSKRQIYDRLGHS